MIYIKPNNDNTVTLGGTVATKEMLDSGYIQYDGVIPELTNEFQHLELVNGVLTIVEDTLASKEKLRQEAKTTRDNALEANTYTLPDGSVYQVRPKDLPNFQTAVQLGVDTDWVLADNSVRLTTVAELQEILNAGVTQAKTIYDTYMATLKTIGV